MTRIMWVILVACLGAVGFELVDSGAADVFLEAKRPDFEQIPIGVLGFPDGTVSDSQGKKVTEILAADLRRSYVFSLSDVTRLGVKVNGAGPPEKQSLKKVTDQGVSVIVWGRLSNRGRDLVLSRHIYDGSTEEMGVSKQYVGPRSLMREMTHRLADELVYRYVGEAGIARTKIAYVGEDEGSRELYVMDYDGFTPRQVTAHGFLNISPAWSPDRRFLVYTSYRKPTRRNIEIIELRSGKRYTLVSLPGMNITPALSPDGSKLAFATSKDGNSEIYTMEMKGRSLVRLTVNRAGDLSPSWSPNGQELVFTSDRGGGPQIYGMNADGSNVRRLTFQGNYNAAPSWSPNGDWIAYVCRTGGRYKICLISPGGGTRKQVTVGTGLDDSPSWAPDGRHLVFSSTKQGQSHIYMINHDGTQRERLTFGATHYSSPSWSPA